MQAMTQETCTELEDNNREKQCNVIAYPYSISSAGYYFIFNDI